MAARKRLGGKQTAKQAAKRVAKNVVASGANAKAAQVRKGNQLGRIRRETNQVRDIIVAARTVTDPTERDAMLKSAAQMLKGVDARFKLHHDGESKQVQFSMAEGFTNDSTDQPQDGAELVPFNPLRKVDARMARKP